MYCEGRAYRTNNVRSCGRTVKAAVRTRRPEGEAMRLIYVCRPCLKRLTRPTRKHRMVEVGFARGTRESIAEAQRLAKMPVRRVVA
jgi:hypothetical protein